MACDRLRASVIGRKRQRTVAELVEHHQQVACRTVEVLRNVMGIDAETAGGVWHELTKAYRADRASRCGIIGALDLDIGAVEERPIGNGEPCATQCAMPGIPQGRGLDRIQDLWRGAGGSWSRDRRLNGSVRSARFCEEKKAPICLLRRGNQLAVGANREDETVGQGQGRGTNACTQCNNER